MVTGDALVEAGPAGTRMELGAAVEQGQGAQVADIGALVLILVELAAERRLGAVIEQDAARFRIEMGGQALDLLSGGRRQVETEFGLFHGETPSLRGAASARATARRARLREPCGA